MSGREAWKIRERVARERARLCAVDAPVVLGEESVERRVRVVDARSGRLSRPLETRLCLCAVPRRPRLRVRAQRAVF